MFFWQIVKLVTNQLATGIKRSQASELKSHLDPCLYCLVIGFSGRKYCEQLARIKWHFSCLNADVAHLEN